MSWWWWLWWCPLIYHEWQHFIFVCLHLLCVFDEVSIILLHNNNNNNNIRRLLHKSKIFVCVRFILKWAKKKRITMKNRPRECWMANINGRAHKEKYRNTNCWILYYFKWNVFLFIYGWIYNFYYTTFTAYKCVCNEKYVLWCARGYKI